VQSYFRSMLIKDGFVERIDQFDRIDAITPDPDAPNSVKRHLRKPMMRDGSEQLPSYRRTG